MPTQNALNDCCESARSQLKSSIRECPVTQRATCLPVSTEMFPPAPVPAGTCVVLFQPGSNDERSGISVAVRERNIATITARLRQREIVVIRVAAAFEAARQGNLQPDGIHYTQTGHALIAKLLADKVATVLSSAPCQGGEAAGSESGHTEHDTLKGFSPAGSSI